MSLPAADVERVWRPLAGWVAAEVAGGARVLGMSGPQGSGKSTVASVVAGLLREARLRAAVLSLDDLYLGRAERAALAGAEHPLFAVRGPPGTHDVPLGERLIKGLLEGSGPVGLPVFDKGVDDRAAEARSVEAPVDAVIFEGWCVGARAETEAQLAGPVNAFEREEDGDGRFRRLVNERLAGAYARLFRRIDRLILLQPPGFEVVPEWRMQAEGELRAREGRGMSDAEVGAFVQRFERISRRIMAEGPERADVVVSLDAERRPIEVSFSDRTRTGRTPGPPA